MTGRLTAITMLAVALCAPVPAFASSINVGAAARPHVSIRPNIVRPTIRPHIRVPSLGRHLARRLRKKHKAHARMRWTGSWSTEVVTPRSRTRLHAVKTRARHGLIAKKSAGKQPKGKRQARKFLSLLAVPLRPAAPVPVPLPYPNTRRQGPDTSVKPPFGAGMRRLPFEPTGADAHDRHANAEMSYLLGRMPRATGDGTNEIRFEDKKGGDIGKAAKKVARPLLIVAEDVEGESASEPAGGSLTAPKKDSAVGLLLPAVQAAR